MDPRFSIFITISKKPKNAEINSSRLSRGSAAVNSNPDSIPSRQSSFLNSLAFVNDSINVQSSHHFGELKNPMHNLLIKKRQGSKIPYLEMVKKKLIFNKDSQTQASCIKNPSSQYQSPLIKQRKEFNSHKVLQPKIPFASEKNNKKLKSAQGRESYRKYISQAKLSFECNRGKSSG
ncbi:hypothetical protein SteCoe_27074 [Stentor coeruleus]|uniref:Uncharacterized protein n=1 Tax=Stentor coeruleus TaxID=5963 RepID=A0A1R2BBD7_9CILI|nr:hypothetical protein SteCoe_27074 [Stentor coeruleus]